MARPKIGIFGALVAVGGLLALRWAQKHRASQASLNRELNRWEDEGGAVAPITQATPTVAGVPPVAIGGTPPVATSGANYPNGLGEAWPFPHS